MLPLNARPIIADYCWKWHLWRRHKTVDFLFILIEGILFYLFILIQWFHTKYMKTWVIYASCPNRDLSVVIICREPSLTSPERCPDTDLLASFQNPTAPIKASWLGLRVLQAYLTTAQCLSYDGWYVKSQVWTKKVSSATCLYSTFCVHQ